MADSKLVAFNCNTAVMPECRLKDGIYLTILRQQHYAILTQLFSGRGLGPLFVDTQSAMQSSTSTS